MQSLKFLALWMLFSVLELHDALKCYSCDHATVEECSQPNIHALSVMTCPPVYTECIKIIGNSSAGDFTIRGCGPPEVCQTADEFFDGFAECHVCSTNLCNSSSILIISHLILTLPLAVYLKRLLV
ncbi:uncharacterized protein LOC129806217 isoform X2 [Phlebotomus papatasi]|uniref:uncharacterized protein LOC129806217 isoform X2 n=1 Tax=Phlebotomus papatasi TaxID=29031 RepID=UPI0024845286|nr:uncharacterized protein LOC129806217 isoform X2 [Phlebotomus papatasi]